MLAILGMNQNALYVCKGQRPCKNGLKHRSGITGAECLTRFAFLLGGVAF